MQPRDDHKSCSGSLLLSVPQMLDPNFMHSVVLVCEHTPEGAFGFVVNQPAQCTIGELVPDHPHLAALRFPVHSGGPVRSEVLQFVHRVPAHIGGGHEIADGLFLGGDVAALAAFAAGNQRRAQRDLRMFLGYSGWGEGQLDVELGTGSWVTLALDPELVFQTDSPETIWRKALRRLGSEGEGLSHLPPDVSWN